MFLVLGLVTLLLLFIFSVELTSGVSLHLYSELCYLLAVPALTPVVQVKEQSFPGT